MTLPTLHFLVIVVTVFACGVHRAAAQVIDGQDVELTTDDPSITVLGSGFNPVASANRVLFTSDGGTPPTGHVIAQGSSTTQVNVVFDSFLSADLAGYTLKAYMQGQPVDEAVEQTRAIELGAPRLYANNTPCSVDAREIVMYGRNFNTELEQNRVVFYSNAPACVADDCGPDPAILSVNSMGSVAVVAFQSGMDARLVGFPLVAQWQNGGSTVTENVAVTGIVQMGAPVVTSSSVDMTTATLLLTVNGRNFDPRANANGVVLDYNRITCGIFLDDVIDARCNAVSPDGTTMVVAVGAPLDTCLVGCSLTLQVTTGAGTSRAQIVTAPITLASPTVSENHVAIDSTATMITILGSNFNCNTQANTITITTDGQGDPPTCVALQILQSGTLLVCSLSPIPTSLLGSKLYASIENGKGSSGNSVEVALIVASNANTLCVGDPTPLGAGLALNSPCDTASTTVSGALCLVRCASQQDGYQASGYYQCSLAHWIPSAYPNEPACIQPCLLPPAPVPNAAAVACVSGQPRCYVVCNSGYVPTGRFECLQSTTQWVWYRGNGASISDPYCKANGTTNPNGPGTSPSGGGEDSKKTTFYASLGAVLAVAAVLVLAFFGFRRWRSSVYGHMEKFVKPDDVTLGDKIGEGMTSVVHSAKWRGTEVAVKIPRDQTGSEAATQFRREITTLIAVGTHPRVVQYLGCCLTPPHMMELMELFHGGSMEQVLMRRKPEAFSLAPTVNERDRLYHLRVITQMLVDASSAVEQLHSQRLIHRDIATRNFLVSSTNRVVIADFGRAKMLDSHMEFHGLPDDLLPIKWAAPESLSSAIHTRQSDVYSFGVFIYEVFARREPYSGVALPEVAVGVTRKHNPLRPVAPAACPVEIDGLMRSCWEADASRRPTIQKINRRLESYLQTLSDSETIDTVYFPVGDIAGQDRSSVAVVDDGLETTKYMRYRPSSSPPASASSSSYSSNYLQMTDVRTT